MPKYEYAYTTRGRKQLRFKRPIISTSKKPLTLQDLINGASKEFPNIPFSKIEVMSDSDDNHNWQNTILEEPPVPSGERRKERFIK